MKRLEPEDRERLSETLAQRGHVFMTAATKLPWNAIHDAANGLEVQDDTAECLKKWLVEFTEVVPRYAEKEITK